MTLSLTVSRTWDFFQFFRHCVDVSLFLLQTLNSISAEKNSTIIFPLPIDLLTHFINGNGSSNGHSKAKQGKKSDWVIHCLPANRPPNSSSYYSPPRDPKMPAAKLQLPWPALPSLWQEDTVKLSVEYNKKEDQEEEQLQKNNLCRSRNCDTICSLLLLMILISSRPAQQQQQPKS